MLSVALSLTVTHIMRIPHLKSPLLLCKSTLPASTCPARLTVENQNQPCGKFVLKLDMLSNKEAEIRFLFLFHS